MGSTSRRAVITALSEPLRAVELLLLKPVFAPMAADDVASSHPGNLFSRRTDWSRRPNRCSLSSAESALPEAEMFDHTHRHQIVEPARAQVAEQAGLPGRIRRGGAVRAACR